MIRMKCDNRVVRLYELDKEENLVISINSIIDNTEARSIEPGIWSPETSRRFAAQFVLPRLIENGWQYRLPDNSGSHYDADGSQFWITVSYIFKSIDIADYEQLMLHLSQYLDDAPDGFHHWLRETAVANKWEKLMKYVLEIEPTSPTLFSTQSVFAKAMGLTDAVNDFIERIKSKSEPWMIEYNIACFYSVLNVTDKAIEHLSRSLEESPNEAFGRRIDSLDNDPDLENVRKACPKEFEDIRNNALGEREGEVYEKSITRRIDSDILNILLAE